VAPADEAAAASLRRVRALAGALLHPMGAYLLHRGIATLPVRLRRQQESARLAEAVYYPGLDGDPRGCSASRCTDRGRCSRSCCAADSTRPAA
jgi:cystathionine beta-lyase/cystathionine gamma-synthase